MSQDLDTQHFGAPGEPGTPGAAKAASFKNLVRGRQSGKRMEMARAVAERTGLAVATVVDLLNRGWTYTETLKERTWTQS
jgi:hypothetical protein